jgi:VanZ family protein
MESSSISKWTALAGSVLVMAIAVDSLVPVEWQVRSGLHWLIEHFLAYFAVTFVLCLTLPRPLIVAGALVALAGLLEALQGLTADRIPDLPTAFCGAAGALTGALLADLLMRVRRERWAGAQAPADGA